MNDSKFKRANSGKQIAFSYCTTILYRINSLHTPIGRPKRPLGVDSCSALVVDGDGDRPDVRDANT